MNHAIRHHRPRLISFGIICFFLVLLGCWNVAGGNGSAKRSTQVARLGREFKLRAQHQVMLHGESLQIKFVAVKEDSRCPADVQCVWAGNAAVQVEVGIRGRGKRSLVLNTNNRPSLDGENQYRGYKFKLVDLNPYPRSSQNIAPRDYVVTLLVSKD